MAVDRTTSYEIPDTAKLQAKFKTSAGVLFDPDSITLTVEEPDGTTTTKSLGDLTKVENGHYTYDFSVTQKGLHTYRFTGVGAVGDPMTKTGYLMGKQTI